MITWALRHRYHDRQGQFLGCSRHQERFSLVLADPAPPGGWHSTKTEKEHRKTDRLKGADARHVKCICLLVAVYTRYRHYYYSRHQTTFVAVAMPIRSDWTLAREGKCL